jgi:short-subunit dehydrogenase
VVRRIFTDGGKLDVLVNSAGISFPKLPFLKEEAERVREAMSVNFLCLYDLTKVIFREMAGQRSGYIMNLASMAGIRGYAGAASYFSSKHAVVGFSDVLAFEGRPLGIKCTAICPGYVDTDVTRDFQEITHAEMIRVEDIANAVEFLLSLSPHCYVRKIQLECVFQPGLVPKDAERPGEARGGQALLK